MTRHQIKRLQCRLRRSVNGLYHSYMTSVLQGLQGQDKAGEVDRVLATAPVQRCCDHAPATAQPSRPSSVQRELKLRADLGCARVRDRLWQLQHLQIDVSPACAHA